MTSVIAQGVRGELYGALAHSPGALQHTQGVPTVRPRERGGVAIVARARGISRLCPELYQAYDTTSRTS